ncbi:hypothetical protein MMC11_008504 [Xylographa trunciseda]|nr:hypothetical protein [Xylographa trunciseda]
MAQLKMKESPSDILSMTSSSQRPHVTQLRAIQSNYWAVRLMLTQAWRDLLESRWYRPTLSADLAAHFLVDKSSSSSLGHILTSEQYLPIGREQPRLLLSGPFRKFLVRVIPDHVTKQYEELEDLDSFAQRELINCASNNYGGFTELEGQQTDLLKKALCMLPFAPAPPSLDQSVRAACADYMGFDQCLTAPSGYSTNILAFRLVAEVAKKESKQCVFICDADSHNSMLTGASMNPDVILERFAHHDTTDLEHRLQHHQNRNPNALICVAIEGLYSMEGSVPPLPDVLALKRSYGFTLLVDEAHSFLALGSAGKGSFNFWQDHGYDCNLREADVMTCMLSKSVGCTGGMVFANRAFAQELRAQDTQSQGHGVEGLATIILLRLYSLICKPLLIQQRMQMRQARSTYMAGKLLAIGCHVISSPGSPIICFRAGTTYQAMTFHAKAFSRGIAVVCAIPPATALWDCRIRLCVASTLAWEDIDTVIREIAVIAKEADLPGLPPVDADFTSLVTRDPEDQMVENETRHTDELVSTFIDRLIEEGDVSSRYFSEAEESEIAFAGMLALHRYGLGPCSARWFYGSFDVFLALEQTLAQLYPSLVCQAGRCRAMICGDADCTLGSTLAASAVPHKSRKTQNLVFVADIPQAAMPKASRYARSGSSVVLKLYSELSEIYHTIAQLSRRRIYLTIHVQAVRDGRPLDLVGLLETLRTCTSNTTLIGITIIIDDRKGLGKIGPRRLGYLDLMESLHGVRFLKDSIAKFSVPVTVLVAGSWFDAFRHQGGYIVGPASAVESLTWNAKAYFWSTPPMPLQAAMSNKALQILKETGKDGRILAKL